MILLCVRIKSRKKFRKTEIITAHANLSDWNSAAASTANLGVDLFFGETYIIGNGREELKGYKITDKCVGCGKCQKVCPQRCIKPGEPFKIAAEHCLHCGACFEGCTVKAVERLG